MVKKFLLLFLISIILGGIMYLVVPKTVIVKTEAIVVERSIEELISSSNLIIKGNVLGKLPSRWSNPGFSRGDEIRNIIQTDVEISISEVMRGTPYDCKKVSVRIEKGKLDGIEYISEDIPDFKIGQNVLLFLSKDDSDVARPDENYYVLTGMGQGLYIKEPYAKSMYTCFYDFENQNIIEESIFKDIISSL